MNGVTTWTSAGPMSTHRPGSAPRPAAYAHGLALALPEKVEMARPTGFERADAINIRIPIEGADIGFMAEGA